MPAATYTPPQTAIIHNTEAYFGASRLPAPVHLVQYDQTVPILAVALYSGGSPYVVPAGAEVNVRMGKSDGTAVYNPTLGLDAARTIAYIAVTPQMTVLPGEYAPILEVVVGGGVAGTSYLSLCVHRNPVQQGDIESTDEFETVQQLAALAQAAADKAASSATTASQKATAAANSAAAAKTSEANAASSKTAAAGSATAAAKSAADAEDSATAAAGSAVTAAQKAEEAAESAESAQEAAAHVNLTNYYTKTQTDEKISAGNVASAQKLATPREINGTPFDGMANIVTKYSYNFKLGQPTLESLIAPT